MKKLKTTLILLFSFILINIGQTQSTINISNINLPNDSITSAKLLQSLDGFLLQKDQPNNENSYVSIKYLLETSALLDELKGIENNSYLKNDQFYSCYLNNVMQLNEKEYLVQFSYIGINEGISTLKASFRIIAREASDQFFFYAPLQKNTILWKAHSLGANTYYYQNQPDLSKIIEYNTSLIAFNTILQIPESPTIIYCTKNFYEGLNLIGVDYHLNYNGRNNGTLWALENDRNLFINADILSNLSAFDPHDLWHSRLRKVLPHPKTNRPVDEGCAYLFGGSWGYSWSEIVRKFKQYVLNNQKKDWLTLYNTSYNFGDELTKPLRVDFIINAFIVKKIYKENDFSPVMNLLSCGKKQENNENYFKALALETGITKSNFNQKINNLILENIQ